MAEEQHPLMPAKQLELILSTWQYCKTDQQAAGVIMFMKLFELDPHLVELFPFGAEGATEDNESLRKHAFGVMSTIDAALEMVQKKEIEELVTTLQELGTVHSLNNIEPVHFGAVGRALIYTLGARAGDAFTEEAKAAWVSLYAIIQAKMTEGMEDASF